MIRTLLKAEDFTKSCWGCSGVQLAPVSWCWRHWAVSLGLGSGNEGESSGCARSQTLSQERPCPAGGHHEPWDQKPPEACSWSPRTLGTGVSKGEQQLCWNWRRPAGLTATQQCALIANEEGRKLLKLSCIWSGASSLPPPRSVLGRSGLAPARGITEVTEPNPPGCSTEEQGERGRLCCCSSPRCQGCGSSVGVLPAAAQVPPGPGLGPSPTLLGRGGGLLLRFWRCAAVQALQQHFSSDPAPFAWCKRQYGPERGAKTSEKLSLCCRLASSWICISRRLRLGSALGGAAQRTLVAVEEWLQRKRR